MEPRRTQANPGQPRPTRANSGQPGKGICRSKFEALGHHNSITHLIAITIILNIRIRIRMISNIDHVYGLRTSLRTSNAYIHFTSKYVIDIRIETKKAEGKTMTTREGKPFIAFTTTPQVLEGTVADCCLRFSNSWCFDVFLCHAKLLAGVQHFGCFVGPLIRRNSRNVCLNCCFHWSIS